MTFFTSSISWPCQVWLCGHHNGSGSRKSLSSRYSMYCLVPFCGEGSCVSSPEFCIYLSNTGADLDFGSVFPCSDVCPIFCVLLLLVFVPVPDWLLVVKLASDWLAWHNVLKNGWSSDSDLMYVWVIRGCPGTDLISGVSPCN